MGDRVGVRARVRTAVAGTVLSLGGCLLETVSERGVPPENFLVPIVVLVGGTLVAPFVPTLGIAAAVVTFPVQVLLDPETPGIGGTALVTMMLLVGHGGLALRPGISAPGAALAAFGGGGALMFTHETAFQFLFFGLTMGGAWSVGWLLRRERERSDELRRLAAALAAEQERSERMAVVEERARISRELHDAVAHTVSVMTLQVGVVRRRLSRGAGLDDAGPECTALRSVEELGRRSVDELRRVVGALHVAAGEEVGGGGGGDGASPAPSLRRLDDLVARLGGVGLIVAVHEEGVPVDLAPALDTSAHRIVTEALTNVLRHACTDRADVVLAWHPDAVAVEILDRGAGPADPVDSDPAGAAVGTGQPPGDPGGGHGLLHMRERAQLFGGRLEAGPRAGGGYRVHALLPLGPAGLRPPAQTAPAGGSKESVAR